MLHFVFIMVILVYYQNLLNGLEGKYFFTAQSIEMFVDKTKDYFFMNISNQGANQCQASKKLF